MPVNINISIVVWICVGWVICDSIIPSYPASFIVAIVLVRGRSCAIAVLVVIQF